MEKDKDQGTHYFKPVWIIGLTIAILSGLLHAVCVPYIDVVLLSTSCVWGVIFANILSIIVLKEKSVPKYDIPAFLCLSFGCLLIISQGYYEERNYSRE